MVHENQFSIRVLGISIPSPAARKTAYRATFRLCRAGILPATLHCQGLRHVCPRGRSAPFTKKGATCSPDSPRRIQILCGRPPDPLELYLARLTAPAVNGTWTPRCSAAEGLSSAPSALRIFEEASTVPTGSPLQSSCSVPLFELFALLQKEARAFARAGGLYASGHGLYPAPLRHARHRGGHRGAAGNRPALPLPYFHRAGRRHPPRISSACAAWTGCRAAGNSNCSISEVARNAGEDAFNFSKLFKKKYGLLPLLP